MTSENLTNPTPVYGLLLTERSDRDSYDGRPSHTLKLVPVLVTADRKIRNPNGHYLEADDPQGPALADLVIRAHATIWRDTPVTRSPDYYWEARYENVYAVDLPRAEAIARTLRKLDRGIAKIHDERGYATDFAEYVVRVCAILGLKHIVWQDPHDTRSGGWSYDDKYHIIATVGNGADHIRGRMYAWWHAETEKRQQAALPAAS